MSKEQQKNGPNHQQPMVNTNPDGNAKGGNVLKLNPKNPPTNKGTTNKDPNNPNSNKENINPMVAVLQGKQANFFNNHNSLISSYCGAGSNECLKRA